MSELLPTPEADDGFRQPETMAEWRDWVPRKPKLMVRNRSGKSGTQWLPGYELNDAYGADQITVLCPGGRQPVTVPMGDVKLWRKDLWKQQQLRDSHKPKVASDTRIIAMPTNENDPGRIVLYVPKTGLFVGGGGKGHGGGKRTITASLDEADSYPNLQGAYSTRARLAAAFHGVEVKYLSRAEASELVRKRAEDQEASQQALDNLYKDHEQERQDAAKAAAEMAAKPVMADVPDEVASWAKTNPTPLPPPAPAPQKVIPTQPAAPVYSEHEQAIMDEAEAEAMMLEAKGRRVRAEARAKIEAMRRAAL